MFKAMEKVGYRMVSRFLPQVTASAKTCGCDPGSGYCQNKTYSNYCYCHSDCVTITCYCNPAGCK